MTSRDRVVVTMDNGPARTGTLLCMGPEEIMLTGSGTLPLSTIRQIAKPRDSALDGVLKGAAVGLVILVFCAPDCPGEYVIRATLGYALIGGTIDAVQGNNKTIYRREPARRSHGASGSDACDATCRSQNAERGRPRRASCCILHFAF